jgi:hypothetical protein
VIYTTEPLVHQKKLEEEFRGVKGDTNWTPIIVVGSGRRRRWCERQPPKLSCARTTAKPSSRSCATGAGASVHQTHWQSHVGPPDRPHSVRRPTPPILAERGRNGGVADLATSDRRTNVNRDVVLNGRETATLATIRTGPPCPLPEVCEAQVSQRGVRMPLVSHGRYVVFQMAEVAIPRQMFQEILQLIAELRPQPPPAPA